MDLYTIRTRFPSQDHCIQVLEMVRWKGVPVCPYCRSDKSTSRPAERRHHCNRCGASFSVTAQTLFHQTRLPLEKWFLAVGLLLSRRQGLAVRPLATALDVNRNTACSVSSRIRRGMAVRSERELLLRLLEILENEHA